MQANQWQTTKAGWTKHLIVALIMAMIGAGIGIQQVYAETKSVSVPGAGSVGTANTGGVPSTNTTGTSTSTILLFHLRAHIKIWHTGPLLQKQENRNWTNSTGGTTPAIHSSGSGDYSTTFHEFRLYSPYSPGTTYTSWNGAYSCAAAWNTYINPPC